MNGVPCYNVYYVGNDGVSGPFAYDQDAWVLSTSGMEKNMIARIGTCNMDGAVCYHFTKMKLSSLRFYCRGLTKDELYENFLKSEAIGRLVK